MAASALFSSEQSPFSPRDKAYYADEATVNFVRPGLVFKVLGHEIATDGTVKVRFRLTDPRGLPLDREGIQTPGTVSTSFVISRIPKGGKFHQPYTKRTKTSTAVPATGKTARQTGADTGGSYTKIADGEYQYTAGTKLPTTYERDATHSIMMYGSRNLSEFDLGTNYATDIYNFVPNGAAVTVLRDVIGDASCNKCHVALGFHGGSRRGIQSCVICHVPAYEDVTNLNPETDNSVDLTPMIHKIHMGSLLPSVQAGRPYRIIRNQTAISDFSRVGMPSDIRRCAWCHDGRAAQGDAHLKNPSRTACGACHDNINFATGENHLGMPQPSDNMCGTCHVPQGEIEWDASIIGAHTIPNQSTMLPKVIATIRSVENNRAGQRLTVNFTLKNAAGQTWDIKEINRVGLVLAGPTTDYVGIGANGYVSEDPKPTATLSGDTYRYTFTTPIPAGATGTFTVGLEGRHEVKLLEGTLKERTVRFGISNAVMNFSVDGSAVVARRRIVSTEKCNVCHANLVLHGENRNKVEQCILCHNPLETDAARRPAAQMPAESINMALMVHRIHAGEEQIRPYIIYGYGGSVNDFSHFAIPTGLNNCGICHEGTSYRVPVAATASIKDPRELLNPVKPATGACIACHTSVDAASHALVNTTTLGESCGVCHGTGKDHDVARVHAN